MKWLRKLLGLEEKNKVILFCPNKDEKVQIEEYGPLPNENNVYRYKCQCGRVHCWKWGPPAPVYIGDKIKLNFTPEGMVQAEQSAY